MKRLAVRYHRIIDNFSCKPVSLLHSCFFALLAHDGKFFRQDSLKELYPLKKHVLSTISIVAASLTVGYIFVFSWAAGHIAGKLGGGMSEGQSGRVKSIIIPLGKWRLHLHHWLCSLSLLSASAASGFYLFGPHVTYGFLGGLAFQGIYCYSDWHRILIRRRQFMGPDSYMD